MDDEIWWMQWGEEITQSLKSNEFFELKSHSLSILVSPSSTLRFKDLVPVQYQEGRYQGDPVTLGVGGFGRVELVSLFLFVIIKHYFNFLLECTIHYSSNTNPCWDDCHFSEKKVFLYSSFLV